MSERRDVSEQIREVVARRGITNALLFAGLASAESTMAHCWADATWACQGPLSADCGGGPVIAGAGDGPCANRQGGLGMYQFDAGDYDDTLAREGTRILSIEGNIEAAVDFVLNMMRQSVYVAGIASDADAIAWLNQVRPGDASYDAWLQTVTHYYNGCVPGRCSVYQQRFQNYDDHHMARYNEFGDAFWYPPPPEPDPAPCTACTLHVGQLDGRGDFSVEPDGSYVFASGGTHEAWLIGEDGTDFDLWLYAWTGSRWTAVAASATASAEEQLTYSGPRGFFAYVVHAFSGSGSYDLYLSIP